ncbi:MAG: imidazole glycerol phosphate synthase subunit HisH [Anaerolineae bacterium]|nr:imidazole glycerol phosphate synthase subunit HisH [Anaerolineae bacterium]NUQ02786.1 imidazole glycerol phosphate synthase subunit HisH [Anaerolineae bacterium]
MLAVVDYGAGNLRSVVHALAHLGVDSLRIVKQPHELKGATRIILPGVGAFGACMEKLREQHLVQPIKDAVRLGIPYLGICLGMQFLFETSDEMGEHAGFGLLPGRVTRFPERPGLKVPHMGWNALCVTRPSPLVEALEAGQHAYFVHSYYCVPANPEDVLITADYGAPFCAGVAHDNIYGVQFHPEKSQQTGLRLLANFLTMTERLEAAV